jgi:diguanylate cyclase (GGDEF)-like protein
LHAALNDHTDRRIEIEIIRPHHGGPRWCLANVTATEDEDDDGFPGAIVTLSDVTEIALLREQLRHRATYDPLTGCLNRASTFHALQHLLSHGRPGTAAIIFIDLDEFKTVNDTFGHLAGDHLLAQIAHLITSQARTQDIVGRIGGDEFVMICHDLTHPTDALAVASRLQQTLSRTIAVADRPVQVSASLGVTMATPGTTAQALINRADEAMYQSKRRPDRQPVFLPTPTDPI